MVRFRRDHPNIRLRTETEGADLLRQRLLDGIIELAISESPVVSPDILNTPFLYDVLVPVVSRENFLVKKKHVSAADFCRQPFIARQVDSGAVSLVEQTLASRGIVVLPILTVGSTEAIKQAVIAGLGVAMISRLAIRAEIAAGQLIELKIKGLAIRYPINLTAVRTRSQSPAARQFLALLKRFGTTGQYDNDLQQHCGAEC